jgi:ATP-dependent Clp protease ATP-binding subunit ClpA
MNDRFTQRVRKVLFLARDEAGRLQHDYIGTEHLLLGIIREGEGVAANVLRRLNLEFDRIQKAIEDSVTAPMGLRPRPHRARPRGQARPGHRPRGTRSSA